MSKNAPNHPILPLPQLTAAPSPAPPRLSGVCKDQALLHIPDSEPWGGHVPAAGSARVSAPTSLWPDPHELDHLISPMGHGEKG